jgi:CRP-like cAMP-binding protein
MLATVIRDQEIPTRRCDPAAKAPDANGDLAAFDDIGTVVSCRRDQALFCEGGEARAFFKVLSGTVRSYRSLGGGRRHISEFLLPGDYVGLALGDIHRATVEAVSDARLMRYSRAAIDRLVQRQPQLGKRLLGVIRSELAMAQSQMLLLGRMTAAERLACFLLMMADRYGNTDCVSLPMTRTDIADHLGLTTETVSRLFSQFQCQGVIRLKAAHEVVLKSRSELQALAEAA